MGDVILYAAVILFFLVVLYLTVDMFRNNRQHRSLVLEIQRKVDEGNAILVREPVAWFVREMEKKLRKYDHRGGWDDCTPGYLLGRLREEVEELQEERARVPGDFNAEISECCDVANFAMMLADKARKVRDANNQAYAERNR